MAPTAVQTPDAHPAAHMAQGANTFYVVNPSKDLAATEQKFAEFCTTQRGWTGTIGSAPPPREFTRALMSHDVFLYVRVSSVAYYMTTSFW